jgi:SAM-dependent methyltransferase
MSLLSHLKRHVRAVFKPEVVLHRGQVLPARDLRFGGAHFLDDEAFLAAGEKDVRRLVEWCGLTRESAILDVGCGTGRLPIGILSALGPVRSYSGLDVSRTAVGWCQRHITPQHPSFHFHHIDVYNERYNPSGKSGADRRFPLSSASLDLIYLYSVFSHMHSGDARAYLREFQRLLKETGSVFLTAFVEEDVPDEEENPPCYQRPWKGALHCVRYSLPFFTRLIEDAGFHIVHHSHSTETDGQSAFVLRLR